jgi:hypothetical protein
MRICRHCQVRVELIDCADGHERWMHKVANNVPGMAAHTLYLECKLPPKVADPVPSASLDRPLTR